jgi:hypothetical protein
MPEDMDGEETHEDEEADLVQLGVKPVLRWD